MKIPQNPKNLPPRLARRQRVVPGSDDRENFLKISMTGADPPYVSLIYNLKRFRSIYFY